MVLGRRFGSRFRRPFSHRRRTRFNRFRRPSRFPMYRQPSVALGRGRSRPMWLSTRMSRLNKPMKTASVIFDLEPSNLIPAPIQGAPPMQPTAWGELGWGGYYGIVPGQAPNGNGLYFHVNRRYPQMPTNAPAMAGLFKAVHINDAFANVHPNWNAFVYIKAVKFSARLVGNTPVEPIFSMVHKAKYCDVYARLSTAARGANAPCLQPNSDDVTISESVTTMKKYIRCEKRDGEYINVPHPSPSLGGIVRVSGDCPVRWMMPDVYIGAFYPVRVKVKIYYRIKNIDRT